MSPSSREQRILSCIADELAASDPKLASTLAVFNRLTWVRRCPRVNVPTGSGGSLVARAEAAGASGSAAASAGQSGWRGLP
jgi:hypothetical protein